MNKKALVIGSGLGGIAVALRLAKSGYKVEMLEKFNQAGGRLNQLKKDGFVFDMGPSFFSMSYEFKEFVKDCNIPMPFEFEELDPLYAVNFAASDKSYFIYKNIKELAQQFSDIEPDFESKMRNFLEKAGKLFHDTEHIVVKRNFNSLFDFFYQLTKVPFGHATKMFRSFWSEMNRYFESEEVKQIFSLVAFFLGATPFDTPAIYTLLTYTELVHDGYYNVKGGMYKIVEALLQELEKENVNITYNTEIVDFKSSKKIVTAFVDQNGKEWESDIFVVNSDAAFFRGKVLKNNKYSEKKLDKMKWTMAPFTIYLGIKGKVENIYHHNYFLGDNFKEYSSKIFKNSISLNKPYYYVNVLSKNNQSCAPKGCESIYILCPVPDLRYKSDWSDKNELADHIINDLSKRIGFDITKNIITKTILDPIDWDNTFNLYKGSGLGLGHNMSQIGAFRPKNKDEKYRNVFYVGSSTVPGTGLPMAIISSKLTANRIFNDYGKVS